MKAHIDTNFTTTDGTYRALHLINPTTNMTGEYTCSVSTNEADDKQKASLTIIQPGKPLEFKKIRSEDGNEIAVSCFVEDASPVPTLLM